MYKCPVVRNAMSSESSGHQLQIHQVSANNSQEAVAALAQHSKEADTQTLFDRFLAVIGFHLQPICFITCKVLRCQRSTARKLQLRWRHTRKRQVSE